MAKAKEKWKMKENFQWGKNLGSVLNTTVGDPEGVDSPVQVEIMLGLPKRQALSQSSLINLDDGNASLLEILHFVLDGQSNLIAGFKSEKKPYKSCKLLLVSERYTSFLSRFLWVFLIPGLVISHEGPVQNSNRASKHSLHWASSHALSHGGPEDCHWLGSAHITIDDWWLHTARSIGLHPSIGSEGKTGQLLSKVLDHIVPLY